MPQLEVPYRGIVTFWSMPSRMRRDPVVAAFTGAGFASFAPRPRTEETALRDALHEGSMPTGARLADFYVRAGKAVAPVAAHYTVFRDQIDPDGKPVPTRVAEGRLIRTPGAERLAVQLATPDDARVRATYDGLLDTVEGGAVGQGLRAAAMQMRGAPLRSTGGVYWMPESAVERWTNLSEALARVDPGATVYSMRQIADQGSVSAILAAIRGKILGELEQIDADLADATVKDTAKGNRRARAASLRAECEALEAELGVSLEALRKACSVRAGAAEAGAAAVEAGVLDL